MKNISRFKFEICTLEDCGQKHKAHGYCASHYRKYRLYGDPHSSFFAPIEERFWQKVEKTETCWIWHGSCFESGYGQFKVEYKNRRVHRYAYELLVGPIPEDMTLDHLCYNKGCVNPKHLEIVTARENYDRVPKDKVCQRGHERIPGSRRCDECSRITSRLRHQKQRLHTAAKQARSA